MQGTLKQGTLKVYPARAYVRARARARVRVRVRVRACVPSAAAVELPQQTGATPCYCPLVLPTSTSHHSLALLASVAH